MLKQITLLGIALGFASAANADRPDFKARLSGAEEVPPVVTNASGRFKIEFKRDLTAGEFELRLNDIVRVTQAHIHCAPPGVNGPIAAFLAGFHERGWDVDGKWVSDTTITDANVIPLAAGAACPNNIQTLADLVRAMEDGNTYVNAHTIANPGGEVRGQITKD